MAASVLNLLCYVVLVKVCEETLTLYTYFFGNRSHWIAISDACGCSSWIQHRNSTWDTSLKLRDAMWGLKQHKYIFLLCSIRIHRSVLNFEWCFLHASLISKVLFNRGTQISRWRYFIMSYPQITYHHQSCQKSRLSIWQAASLWWKMQVFKILTVTGKLKLYHSPQVLSAVSLQHSLPSFPRKYLPNTQDYSSCLT